MRYELFIVNKLLKYKQDKKSISKYITKISSVSVSLGIIIMIISISTGIGLKNKIREKISGYNGHLQIVSLDYKNKATSKPISLDQPFYNGELNLDYVSHIQPFSSASGILKGKDDFEGVVVKGVDDTYNWDFFKDYILEGSIPNYIKNKRNDTIMVSKKIANSLDLNLHDNVKMIFLRDEKSNPLQRKFIIGGIFNTGMKNFDENNIISCIWHVQKINNWDTNQVSGFEVTIKDFDEIHSISKKLYRDINLDLDVETIYDNNYSLLSWVELFDINILSIIIIMIVISGINIITILLTFILERTNMIGILKALGNNNYSIRKIFILISVRILFKGLLYGNIIAISIILLQKNFGFITLNPDIYHTNIAPFDFNILHILCLNIFTIFICTIMMIIPSYIISRISPSKTMKFS